MNLENQDLLDKGVVQGHLENLSKGQQEPLDLLVQLGPQVHQDPGVQVDLEDRLVLLESQDYQDHQEKVDQGDLVGNLVLPEKLVREDGMDHQVLYKFKNKI